MTQKITYFKIGLLLLFCSLLNLRTFAQNENIGFELGNTTNWICGTGTYGDIHEKSCTLSKFPFIITFDGICMNQGGMDGSNIPTDGASNRHTIVSTGSDPNSLNHISCVAPANLFPSNANKYSFRLGNTRTINPVVTTKDSLAYAEGIAFKLSVDSSNFILTYLYAAFVIERNPAHKKAESPRFIVKVTDSKDSLVKGSYKEMTEDDTIFKDGYTDVIGIWRYTDWTKVSLDLSTYIGQTLTVTFMTSDCYAGRNLSDSTCMYEPGAHSAYAYIDLYTESSLTGIATDKNNIAIQLFPNPMSLETNIRINGLPNDASTYLTMYDCLGKQLKSQSLKNGSQKLYRDDLPNGIYFIEIVHKGELIEKRKLVLTNE